MSEEKDNNLKEEVGSVATQADPQESESNEERKIFIGGLSMETTEEDIVSYFKQYGEIDSTTFKTNPVSGRTQGYAFLVFKKKTSRDAALSVLKHLVGGRQVSVEKAQIKKGKIFVFRVKPEMTEEVLRLAFSSYGNVIEFEQPVDKSTNTKKTFCFVTFDREAPAHNLIKQGSIKVNEDTVSIGKVNPKADHRGGAGGGYSNYPYQWGPPFVPEFFGIPWGWDPYYHGGGGRGKTNGLKFGGRGRGGRSRPY
jgi:RNA recognition motif-containing protein